MRKTDPRIKAKVVAALLAGQGVMEASRNTKVPFGTVSRWKSQLTAEQLADIDRQKSEEFTGLVCNALREVLETLAVSAKWARSPEARTWYKQNSPAEVATFIGVITDKGFRLLEAAEFTTEVELDEDEPMDAVPGPTSAGVH